MIVPMGTAAFESMERRQKQKLKGRTMLQKARLQMNIDE
jgi:hypothetical protein